MKYPKTIDTLLYKRLDESSYKVKNAETGEIFELGRAIVSFMNKLDGKTDPFMINTCLSDFEIEEIECVRLFNAVHSLCMVINKEAKENI